LAVNPVPNAELTGLTLSEASERVRKKAISPVELTKACLLRIEQLNLKLNAYITVAMGQALASAQGRG
jgi:Asp-tRNA(Asn)/Glu-tRNA(Gln) amidotransferase A subunit family amidase